MFPGAPESAASVFLRTKRSARGRSSAGFYPIPGNQQGAARATARARGEASRRMSTLPAIASGLDAGAHAASNAPESSSAAGAGSGAGTGAGATTASSNQHSTPANATPGRVVEASGMMGKSRPRAKQFAAASPSALASLPRPLAPREARMRQSVVRVAGLRKAYRTQVASRLRRRRRRVGDDEPNHE